MKLHRYFGGFHITVLTRAWFHRAAAVVGADPSDDLRRILTVIRDADGKATGSLLLEQLGLSDTRILLALDEAKSRGYVKLAKLAGMGARTIALASITATGKRALKDAGV